MGLMEVAASASPTEAATTAINKSSTTIASIYGSRELLQTRPQDHANGTTSSNVAFTLNKYKQTDNEELLAAQNLMLDAIFKTEPRAVALGETSGENGMDAEAVSY